MVLLLLQRLLQRLLLLLLCLLLLLLHELLHVLQVLLPLPLVAGQQPRMVGKVCHLQRGKVKGLMEEHPQFDSRNQVDTTVHTPAHTCCCM